MKVRLAFSLLALGLTAFAPAPLPRREREKRPDEINLTTFQGNWRVTKQLNLRADGNHLLMESSITHVRILKDRWTFMSKVSEGATLSISLDPSKKPTWLNFYRAGRKDHLRGVGLVRRHGRGVEVLYCWCDDGQDRPLDFDPPRDGDWVISMQRDN
jgi:uncharacterized protein (TIGR03067 family)